MITEWRTTYGNGYIQFEAVHTKTEDDQMMTDEESQSKMVAILEKHGLAYPTLGEDFVIAWPKLIAAFEFFDHAIVRESELVACVKHCHYAAFELAESMRELRGDISAKIPTSPQHPADHDLEHQTELAFQVVPNPRL